MEKSKIFDDYEEVSCNDCEHYYTNACDGVHKAQKRLCNQFMATRKVVLPLQIKSLQRGLKWLTGAIVILAVVLVIHIILHIIFG